MDADQLTIRVAGSTEFISVASFLAVVGSTLDILKDLDATISRRPDGTIDWRIVEVSLNSPLTLTIFAESTDEVDVGREVITAYTEGLRQIELRPNGVPPHFTDHSLEVAKKLVSVLNDSVSKITFIDPWSDPVSPSQRLAANIDDMLPEEHEELGTIEGKLETLSIHGRATFNVWDVLTGARVNCRLSKDQLVEAHAAFGHRVAVSGKVRYSRTGRPLSINVEEIRLLREQKDLPQFKDLEGIDLTDGVDPVEYIRRLRDAE